MALDRVAKLVQRAAQDTGVFDALRNNPARLKRPLRLSAAHLDALHSASVFPIPMAGGDFTRPVAARSTVVRTLIAPGQTPPLSDSTPDSSGLLPPEGSGQFVGTAGVIVPGAPQIPAPSQPPKSAPPATPPSVAPRSTPPTQPPRVGPPQPPATPPGSPRAPAITPGGPRTPVSPPSTPPRSPGRPPAPAYTPFTPNVPYAPSAPYAPYAPPAIPPMNEARHTHRTCQRHRTLRINPPRFRP